MEAEIEILKPEKAKKEKKKTGRLTLTENQEEWCKLVVAQGIDPLEAMLQIFPNRKAYSIGNQRRLLKELQNNPRILKRLEELFTELRENTVLGDLYNFDKGVKLLTDEIELAQGFIKDGKFSEALHRIILTSVQELNRMYGYNIVDRNGNAAGGGNVNVTFINVKEPERD